MIISSGPCLKHPKTSEPTDGPGARGPANGAMIQSISMDWVNIGKKNGLPGLVNVYKNL